MHAVPTAERKYVGDVHELLLELRSEGKEGKADGGRNAFVYNFRTGGCVYYDLGA